jgi:hypothetical protein
MLAFMIYFFSTFDKFFLVKSITYGKYMDM